MKLFTAYIISLIVVPFNQWQSSVGYAQKCLHAEQDTSTGPPFRDKGNSPTLPTGSQAVIDTYTFRCCGRIAEWRAYFKPGNIRYDITFQVWRPTVGEAAGCYTLVGENTFQNVRPSGNLVELSNSSAQISFQEGDKVGYYVKRLDGSLQDGGIQLEISDSNYRNDMVWYNISTNKPIYRNCPFCSGVGGMLATSTRAAPAISAVLSTSTCKSATQPSSTIPSSCVPTTTLLLTTTLITSTVLLTTSTLPKVTPSSSMVVSPTVVASIETAANTVSPNLASSLTPSASFPTTVSLGQEQILHPTSVTGLLQSQISNSFAQSAIGANSVDTFSFNERGSINGGISSNLFVVLGVIIVFLIMLVVVTLVVLLVIIPKKKIFKGKSSQGYTANPAYHLQSSKDLKTVPLNTTEGGIANPAYDLQKTKGHTTVSSSADIVYETIDETENTVKGVEGIYSLYSLPEVPLPRSSRNVYSSVDDELNMYDKDKGYSLIRPQKFQPTGGDSKAFDSSTYEYACTGSKLERFQLPALESPGLVVPTQKEREKVTPTDEKMYKKLNFFEKEPIYWKPASTLEALYEQLSFRKYREIPRKQVIISQELGSGQFGIVMKAVWKFSNESIFMAAKKLRASVSSTERVKFLQEAAIMGQFHHPNVVKLYGLMTIGEPLTLCLEYMENGDLKEYLSSFNIEREFPPRDYKNIKYFLIQAANDVASGLTYLYSKSFVHRDLAARNVLLNASMTCKIGDFGMARDLMDDTYYILKDQRAIPIRWTAPEALLFKKYSTNSDVWSYGMLLYEIWSMGKDPFPSMENKDLPDLFKIGYCQPPPPGCPRAIYQLMVDCWNPVHGERPKINEVLAYLNQPVSKLLYWSPQDDIISERVSALGGNPAEGQALYKDLQIKYIKNNTDKPTTYF